MHGSSETTIASEKQRKQDMSIFLLLVFPLLVLLEILSFSFISSQPLFIRQQKGTQQSARGIV
jgi:hypothetical protein